MARLTRLRATYRCLENVALDLTDPDTGEGSPFIALVGDEAHGRHDGVQA
jgi:hypothetical protein